MKDLNYYLEMIDERRPQVFHSLYRTDGRGNTVYGFGSVFGVNINKFINDITVGTTTTISPKDIEYDVTSNEETFIYIDNIKQNNNDISKIIENIKSFFYELKEIHVEYDKHKNQIIIDLNYQEIDVEY